MTAANPIDDPAYHLFQQRFGALRRSRQTESLLTVAAIILLFVVAAVWTDFSPEKIANGIPRIGEYFGKLLSIEPTRGADPVAVLAWPHLFGGVKEPQSIAYWFYRIGTYLALLWQTIEMAILATAIGFGVAFALSFPATRTFVGNRAIVFITRRVLEVMRTIPQVVLAFILVWPFGIGPLAGILAVRAAQRDPPLRRTFRSRSQPTLPRQRARGRCRAGSPGRCLPRTPPIAVWKLLPE